VRSRLFVGLVAVGAVLLLTRLGPTPAASAAGSPSPDASSPAATASATPTPVPTTNPAEAGAGCTPSEHSDWSVARRWDEALLDAIRRALPNPPVHARNLFHLSVAMWDAWAAYDPTALGYLVTEKHTVSKVLAARNEAISYAAYGVLRARFAKAAGGEDSLTEFDDLMRSLCYATSYPATKGASPAALGTRIAAAVLSTGLADRANEAGGYGDPLYEPVNQPLTVAKPGATMLDPNRWQPLEIVGGFSQNGIPTGTVQVAVDPHWGYVKGFGPLSAGVAGTPIDPGPPPRLGDAATDAVLKEQIVDLIRKSSQLDPSARVQVDISPASLGANPLGSNDGRGLALNPVTGAPYVPEIVNQGDFARVVAEFWADGPRSETPPGHWNVIANDVSDALAPELRIGGRGAAVDRLQWDVKLYLSLNGAVHNAAIVAWGLKGRYDSSRPISLIRYMGGLGQSSDPSGPSYNREGLPLVPGLIEVVTTASSARGERHAALAGHVGAIAIRAWQGNPKDPTTQVGGVGWILATTWVPYQLPTFVTPSFPAYASGHSTFSRAAAEVLTGFTGSMFFPGGIATYARAAGSLGFEAGPTTDVVLEWATYYDAADQAGLSRLYGGIHIQADDFTGRRMGSVCGRAAWHLAQEYFAGTIAPRTFGCAPIDGTERWAAGAPS